MEALAPAVGMNVGTQLSLEKQETTVLDTEFSRSLEASVAIALERNPNLTAARAQLGAARHDVESARGDGLPPLSLGVNLARNN